VVEIPTFTEARVDPMINNGNPAPMPHCCKLSHLRIDLRKSKVPLAQCCSKANELLQIAPLQLQTVTATDMMVFGKFRTTCLELYNTTAYMSPRLQHLSQHTIRHQRQISSSLKEIFLISASHLAFNKLNDALNDVCAW